jgi:uncharacterized protein YuzE
MHDQTDYSDYTDNIRAYKRCRDEFGDHIADIADMAEGVLVDLEGKGEAVSFEDWLAGDHFPTRERLIRGLIKHLELELDGLNNG